MNPGKMTSRAAFSAAAALLCVIFSSCDGDEAVGESRAVAFPASIQAQDSTAAFETTNNPNKPNFKISSIEGLKDQILNRT